VLSLSISPQRENSIRSSTCNRAIQHPRHPPLLPLLRFHRQPLPAGNAGIGRRPFIPAPRLPASRAGEHNIPCMLLSTQTFSELLHPDRRCPPESFAALRIVMAGRNCPNRVHSLRIIISGIRPLEGYTASRMLTAVVAGHTYRFSVPLFSPVEPSAAPRHPLPGSGIRIVVPTPAIASRR